MRGIPNKAEAPLGEHEAASASISGAIIFDPQNVSRLDRRKISLQGRHSQNCHDLHAN